MFSTKATIGCLQIGAGKNCDCGIGAGDGAEMGTDAMIKKPMTMFK